MLYPSGNIRLVVVYKNLELRGEICVVDTNLGVIIIWMMFKTQGMDRVTERLSGLMVIITIEPVATSVFGYHLGFKALVSVIG